MFDLREHENLIQSLVAEANQNDPNWEWTVRRINKNEARIFWSYLEYCDEAELSFAVKLGEENGKGWMLEKIWNGFWKYRKIQPQKLKFAVIYFWEASDENMQHTENQEIFLESCEQAGWRLCAEWMQMQIFCSEQENPIPIETDEAAKLDNIHLCMSQKYLKTNLFLLLIMSVLSFSSGVNLIKTPLSALTISSIFWGTVFTVAFLVYLLWTILGYWNWYRASKASVRWSDRRYNPA